jgi:hypothetical protein
VVAAVAAKGRLRLQPNTTVIAMRTFTLLLSIAGCLAVGCSYRNPLPAAEADALGEGLEAAGFGQGRVWEVGPERDYKTPSAVAGKVGDGDVVLIDAATYACDAGVVWYADRLTLKGVGGRPHLDAGTCVIPGGKAIWNPLGTDLLVENIEFSGAAVSDGNGAGIRFQGEGRVIIRNAFFHDNENGILFTPPYDSDTDLLIEHSEFAYNGTEDGQAHNVYVNAGRSLTFRYNYSHDSHVGHLLKTRARSNYILYNRLMTMDGTGSYEVDLANGGDAWLIGNVIQQGAGSENQSIIAYGAEQAADAENQNRLYLVNNTVINDRQEGVTLIRRPERGFDALRLANNLLVGVDQAEIEDLVATHGALAEHNLITRDPGFQDRKHYNYALAAGAPAIDAGADPGTDHLGAPLAPDRVYRHPFGFEPRPTEGAALDLGALEFDGAAVPSPAISFEAKAAAIAYGADADFTWKAAGAGRCLATGDWDGERAPEGAVSVGPLHQSASFELACDGPGGVAQASIDIAVADHPLAATYPDYRFAELDGTRIRSLCPQEPLFEGMGECGNRDLSAAYVPEQNASYLFGGGDRNYFGNEVIKLDLGRRSLAVVAGPTDPRDTRNYDPAHEGEWDLIRDCRGVWDLNDGGVAPSPARVFTSWLYAPSAGKIFKNGGRVACGSSWYDQDSWWFDPHGDGWQLIERDGGISSEGTHAVLDPDSGQILILGHGGVYRFDPAKEDRVRLGAFGDVAWSTTPVLDPVNDVIVIIGNGEYQYSKFTVIDILGVDAEATSLPQQVPWTARGDLSLLDMNSPALAYDSDRKVVVGWGGGPKLYFLRIDREARAIEFIARTLDQAPTFTWPKRNSFHYASKEKAFVAYAGADSNFYLLKAED